MMDYNTSLDMIAQKVKQFHTNRAAYHAPEYKEADARQELIDPFFVALGWDVHNEQHTAPQYRNVSIGLRQLVSEFTEAASPCCPLVWAD